MHGTEGAKLCWNCTALKIVDIDSINHSVWVRDGKGRKDRIG